VISGMALFALPMMAGNLLQQAYNIVDTVVVGRYVGPGALAAVGSAYTLMTFLTSLVIGLCMGSGALFSQSYGAANKDMMRLDIRLSAVFIGTVTLLIMAVIFPATDAILSALQVPNEIYGLMRGYVTIVFCGIGFTSLYNFFAYLLRSMGNSLVPLWFLALSCASNITLDLWFVRSLGWGVDGVAASTVISEALAGCGIALYAFVRYRDLFWAPTARVEGRMAVVVRNDVLTGLQQSVMNLGILMVQGLVNTFGTTVMAAFAAAVKIDTLAYMPAQEFANAYSLFVSQNYGAGKGDRIIAGTKAAFLGSVAFCACVSLAIWQFAPVFMTVFVDPSEMAVVSEGVRYLHVEGSFYIGIGVLFLLYGYFRAVREPGMSLVLTVVSLGTRVVLSYALAPTTPLGVLAIWWSIPIGWVIADAVGLVWLAKGRPLQVIPSDGTSG
jgi:putative MATE family efflux protein